MQEHLNINTPADKAHFLPSHEVAGFTSVNNLKVFENKGLNLLHQVSEALKAPMASKTKSVSSIPTIFARPLLFKMALFDEKHPLHNEIVDEWRGFISCFILAQQFQLEISFDRVEYDPKSKFFKAYEKLAFEPEKIGRDEPGSVEEYKWTEPYTISISTFVGNTHKKMVVGGTSPSTLFYTSPDYTEVAKALAKKGVKISGRSNNEVFVFSQPDSDEHILIIHRWLHQLVSDGGRLKRAFTDDFQNKTKSEILRLFDKWKTDLETIILKRGLVSDETLTQLNIPGEEELTQFPFPHKDFKLYRLASAPMTTQHIGVRSDLLLSTSALPDNSKKIIICDEVFNLATDLIIYNTRTKSNTGDWRPLFKGGHGNAIGGQPLPEKVEWIVPQRYFISQDLIATKEGRSFVKTETPFKSTDGTGYEIKGGSRFVLPFTKEFLNLFIDGQDLLERVQPAFETNDGKVVFSFTLTIKYLGRDVDIRISKTYAIKPENEEGQIIEVDSPPLVAFWPHFYHQNWERYFIYKRKMVKNGRLEFEFEPLAFSNVQWNRVADPSGNDKYDLEEITCFPESFIVKYRSFPVGCILVKRIPTNAGIDANFGVDFGTSNTNVWYKGRDNDTPEVLKITVTPRVLTENSADMIGPNLATSFFPYETPIIPFATVVKKLIPNAKRPIFDGMIQFVAEPKLDNTDNLLETNIKWGGDEDIRNLFVEHLLLLICAEARNRGASRIDLSVSYPLAYDPQTRSGYIRSFEDLVKKKFSWFGEKSIFINSNKSREDIYTESVAVGKYFVGEGDKKIITGGAVCVDVGGGTSDISIWYNKSIVYQSSLYLAGNIVSNSFRKSLELRRVLFRNIEDKDHALVDLLTDSIRNKNTTEDDSFFAATFNLLLKKYGTSIESRLSTLMNNETFERFRTIIIVEYAAIIFYCGMLIHKIHLDDESKLDLLPNLYWAGGASAFVKWIDYGSNIHKKSPSYILFSEIVKYFYYMKQIQENRSFKASTMDVELTNSPKSECAKGLLVNALNIEDAVAPGSALLGDDIKLNTGDSQIIDFTTELNLKNNKPSQRTGVIVIDDEWDETLEEDPGIRYYQAFQEFGVKKHQIWESMEVGSWFTTFIKILNKLGRDYGVMQSMIKLDDYPQLSKNIKAEIKEQAISASNDDKNRTVRVEPIFIIEVKELIKEMIKKLPD